MKSFGTSLAIAAAVIASGSMLGAGRGIRLTPAVADPEPIPLIRPLIRKSTYRAPNGGSRYMPHIGAKERARHAGKPDGPMHVTGHERRAALLEWAASH